MKFPPPPSNKTVNGYLKTWTTLESYILQEKSLGLLFKKLCPDNTTIESVLLKVNTLNDFYSTHIFDTYTVAKHILSCNIDLKLKNGDVGLVNQKFELMLYFCYLIGDVEMKNECGTFKAVCKGDERIGKRFVSPIV